jgi:hypothetical protein
MEGNGARRRNIFSFTGNIFFGQCILQDEYTVYSQKKQALSPAHSGILNFANPTQ